MLSSILCTGDKKRMSKTKKGGELKEPTCWRMTQDVQKQHMTTCCTVTTANRKWPHHLVFAIASIGIQGLCPYSLNPGEEGFCDYFHLDMRQKGHSTSFLAQDSRALAVYTPWLAEFSLLDPSAAMRGVRPCSWRHRVESP